MNLIIDQGNTSTKVAFFEGDALLEVKTFGNEHISSLLSHPYISECDEAIYSSVAACESDILMQLRAKIPQFIELDHNTKLPIKIDYKTPQTLGVDRVAAAVGAWMLNPDTPLLVIDAGTAITYDFVTSQGVYRGGNIAPGVTMRLKALNYFTNALPLVELSDEFPMLGEDTNSAILSGAVSGVVYEIEGYISKIYEKEHDLRVILTGGDHLLLYNRLKNSIFVPLNNDDSLVLKGLNAILRYNVEK